MIVKINDKRIKKDKYQTYKIKGVNQYELHYIDRKTLRMVNICLEYGGKLATSIGNIGRNGKKIKRYEVSFNKLPDNIKKQVVTAILYIEENGTPMENDESVFSY